MQNAAEYLQALNDLADVAERKKAVLSNFDINTALAVAENGDRAYCRGIVEQAFDEMFAPLTQKYERIVEAYQRMDRQAMIREHSTYRAVSGHA